MDTKVGSIGDSPDNMGFDTMSMLMGQQAPLFGPYGGQQQHDDSITTDGGGSIANLQGQFFQDDPFGGFDDNNDPKRRRIARVSFLGFFRRAFFFKLTHPISILLGVRHVPKKEDKVRWEDATMHALYQLQDRLCIYAGGEEKESSKRVCKKDNFIHGGRTLLLLLLPLPPLSR